MLLPPVDLVRSIAGWRKSFDSSQNQSGAVFDRAALYQLGDYRIISYAGTTLTILGVYRPEISTETWNEQWAVTGDDEQTQEHFRTLVLIEAAVEGLDGPFEMDKFGQIDPDFPDDPRYMQVGYDEALLPSDGEIIIDRRKSLDWTSGL